MASVACIGECMVELRQAQGGQSAGQSGQGGGLYSRGFGGDTLNTAVYLARLEVKVDYLTALGDDALSDEMIAAWTAEAVGTRFVFDTNFRARGWPDRDVAREVLSAAFAAADIVLTSTEDLLALYPGESHEQLMARIPSPELVFRLAEPVSLLRFPGGTSEVRAEPLTRPVVDTTAAGDSFAAAYIAARLAGSDPVEAAQAGHRLASLVICYPGAIIPGYAMPPKKRHRPPTSRQVTK